MSDSARDYRDAIIDIVKYLEAAESFAGRYSSFDEFAADEMATFALVRAIEVAGEAARRVPADVRAKHAEVPWKQMIGMRDRLIHGYDQINLPVVWETAKTDAPAALEAVRRMIDWD